MRPSTSSSSSSSRPGLRGRPGSAQQRNSSKLRDPERKRYCRFCVDRSEAIDYRDDKRLIRCMSEQGKILPRRLTGVCALHQRQLARAIKYARHLALLPFKAEAMR